MTVNKKILSDFQDLMLDWDQTLNEGIVPSELTSGSHKYINWRCHKCGRIWKTSVKNRVNGAGCSCDAKERQIKKLRRRLVNRDGSLAQTRPEIAAQWHPLLNGDITPNDITEKSMYKAWWLGEDGIAWQSVVSVRCRVEGGTKRPKSLVIPGVNDLRTIRPDLAQDWNFDKNQDIDITSVMPGSKYKVWWICKKGHEWQATIISRNDGRGCPICNRERNTSFPEQAIFYYIKKIFPDAKNRYNPEYNLEVDVFIPSQKIAVEYDGKYFHSSKRKKDIDIKKNQRLSELGIILIRIVEEGGNPPEGTPYVIYCPRVNNVAMIDISLKELLSLLERITGKLYEITIDSERDRLEIYDQYIFEEKKNSLSSVAPEVVAEWHKTKNGRINPEYVHAMSNKIFWWKCNKCGYEWKAPPYRRVKGNGCPVCSGKVVVPGINDLPTLRPDLMDEWNYNRNNNTDPRNCSVASNKKVWWKCRECSFEWEAVIFNRTRGTGCPRCSGRVVSQEKSFSTLYPNLALQWVTELNLPFQPKDFLPNSDKRFWWKCEKGHVWESTISHRTNGNNCPYCGNRKVLAGFNDLSTTHPELVNEWDFEKNTFNPDQVMAGSRKKVWWKCKNGHKWQAAISMRVKGTGCPYCHGKKVNIGINDLKTAFPYLAREWDYEKNNNLLPTEVTPGSNKRVWWKCLRCKGEWETPIWSRVKGRGCPYCAGVKPIKGVNDLPTKKPELMLEWNSEKNKDIDPTNYMPSSRAKVWWKCKTCKFEWEASIGSRTQGRGCPKCAGKHEKVYNTH